MYVQVINQTNGAGPHQVHLTYWAQPDSMLVSFVTGEPVTSSTPAADLKLPNTTATKPVVQYSSNRRAFSPVNLLFSPFIVPGEAGRCASLGLLDRLLCDVARRVLGISATAGFNVAYVEDTAWPGYTYQVTNYASALISHVLLTGESGLRGRAGTARKPAAPWRRCAARRRRAASDPLFMVLAAPTGLKPSTTYYYRVAASAKGPWSKEFKFTTPPAKAAYPFT